MWMDLRRLEWTITSWENFPRYSRIENSDEILSVVAAVVGPYVRRHDNFLGDAFVHYFIMQVTASMALTGNWNLTLTSIDFIYTFTAWCFHAHLNGASSNWVAIFDHFWKAVNRKPLHPLLKTKFRSVNFESSKKKTSSPKKRIF